MLNDSMALHFFYRVIELYKQTYYDNAILIIQDTKFIITKIG